MEEVLDAVVLMAVTARLVGAIEATARRPPAAEDDRPGPGPEGPPPRAAEDDDRPSPDQATMNDAPSDDELSLEDAI